MNVRQVRKKIKSITNVKKITKAMELVSGIKMRRAQEAELNGRPYRVALEAIINKIVPGIEKRASLLTVEPKEHRKRELVLVITSNKGLCGAYNINLLRFLLKQVNTGESDFITVGKKGSRFLVRIGKKILADFTSFNSLNEISAIFSFALTKYLSKDYNKVSLVYTRFISTLKSEPSYTQLLPVIVDFSEKEDVDKKRLSVEKNYLIEPSSDEIVDYLLKSYLEDKIRGAIISSEAVEHSARMIAMKNATDNADDVIYNFTLLGNKLRQERITNELLDMVTAKESVEGN